MDLTAINRYLRICKSDVECKRFFPPRKSRLVLVFAWSFITCYVQVPRLVDLQGFHFVPEYASWLNQHLSTSSKIVHYFVIVDLFFLLPLGCRRQCTWNSKEIIIRRIIFVHVMLGFRLCHHHLDTLCRRNTSQCSAVERLLLELVLLFTPEWILCLGESLQEYSAVHIIKKLEMNRAWTPKTSTRIESKNRNPYSKHYTTAHFVNH